jgi:hypothetical protein
MASAAALPASDRGEKNYGKLRENARSPAPFGAF